MRIAHFGDLHVTDGARLDDQRATLDALVADILATAPDLVLVGGDLYGRTVPHRSTPAERGVLFPALVQLAKAAPVVVVRGNHDHEEDIAGLAHLGGDWPIRVVTGAEVLDVMTPGGTCHVYGLAYPTKSWLLARQAVDGGLVGAQVAIEEQLSTLLKLWTHRIRRRRAVSPDEPHVMLGHVQIAGSLTSGGEVLAGQEIELSRAMVEDVPFDYVALGHLHRRQEVALRAWYPGSPWRNDFSETDPKGWHLVEVAEDGYRRTDVGPPPDVTYPKEDDRYGRRKVLITWYPSNCREFVTLDYVYGEGGWISRPPIEQLEACFGAEVRARLRVSEQWERGCPWDAELRALADVAYRVHPEKTIEPVDRVRAPAVAAAESDEDKLRALWGTLAAPPSEGDQARAIAALRELGETDDAAIAETTRRIG